MKNILDYNENELREIVENLGQPKYRVGQIYARLSGGYDFSEMSELPKSLIEQLSKDYYVGVKIVKRLTSKDGSEKYLYELWDGNVVEGVFMPHDYGNTLCVSTQVGCRMKCAFCASGMDGLIRNLSSGEILGQVTAVNRLHGGSVQHRAVTNVVLMGSGEPLDNYENVAKFLKLVSAKEGINISQRNISLSTCGIAEKIRQLADDGFSVTLSLSLHATTDESRRNLMPIANKYELSEVLSAVRYYFEKTGRRIIFEYSMVKGENMDYFDAKRLGELTKGFSCHVNLIMLNRVEGKDIKGCTKMEADRFLERLKGFNVSATIRRSFGSDIEGACGQLRRRVISEKK